MKNKTIELNKLRAKQYHLNTCGKFTDGIISRHCYSDMTPDTLTHWDDAVFIVNNYRVALWWRHPRYAYAGLVAEAARKSVEHLRPEETDLFAGATANYKKVGRSRKKIVSWTMAPLSPELAAYYEALKAAEIKVGETEPFEVRPKMQLSWTNWCRGIDLCVPFEVRSEQDLGELCKLAKRLVKRESTLAQEFGDYVYSFEDWICDQKKLQEQRESRSCI